MQISSDVIRPRADVHVVPMGNLWATKVERTGVYSGIFDTQLEATSSAMSLARMAGASVILHDQQGRFREVWNYENHHGPRLIVRG